MKGGPTALVVVAHMLWWGCNCRHRPGLCLVLQNSAVWLLLLRLNMEPDHDNVLPCPENAASMLTHCCISSINQPLPLYSHSHALTTVSPLRLKCGQNIQTLTAHSQGRKAKPARYSADMRRSSPQRRQAPYASERATAA
jgi:hypothetical protein